MNRISWSEALRASGKPAIIVGPIAGILGGAMLAVNGIAHGGGSIAGRSEIEGAAALFFGSSYLGAFLGFILASPVVVLFATLWMKLGSVFHSWSTYSTWAIGGLIAGAICSFAYTVIDPGQIMAFHEALTFFGPIAIVGALIARWIVREKIRAFSQGE